MEGTYDKLDMEDKTHSNYASIAQQALTNTSKCFGQWKEFGALEKVRGHGAPFGRRDNASRGRGQASAGEQLLEDESKDDDVVNTPHALLSDNIKRGYGNRGCGAKCNGRGSKIGGREGREPGVRFVGSCTGPRCQRG